ncbi:O-methyltransferase 1, chloroplastic-like isoform X3 [Lolium rigidum]|uniref:O-methyltransferase 1, chloroplastic-like isoform X3 n=1 Tax=Lolium rigidum TaxID=89674 RepID=UPI001F5DB2E5|nr:O-methyltransferase 1, chloroplastic-like isoform X3 [Lolium rigidum]XP_047078496.1 O-methyltransferase 1, chloroplastic-like isoform X3 [Lolium rigidum]
MLVLPTLAARPLRPPPRLAPPPLASSWNCRTKRTLLQPGPFAAGADTPRGRGGPLPEPEQRDQLLLAALHAARLRDEESRRPDGMDTRPYRLSWPKLSVVYDVSPGRVFSAAAQQLRGAGAKIPRNCVLLHTPLESPNLQEGLCKNGFNGNRPSLWVLQGLPLFTSSSLESLLLVISSLAMKGSIFIGELTHFPDWTAAADMVSEKDRLENLFFTQGFQVSFVHYENVAKDLGLGYENVAKDLGLGLAPPRKQCGRVLLVAEQLRFSDAQMESFRSHFERTEEDADEEGFEEL